MKDEREVAKKKWESGSGGGKTVSRHYKEQRVKEDTFQSWAIQVFFSFC